MRLLALDSAMRRCSAAVFVDDHPRVARSGGPDAEELIPLCSAVLAEAGLTFRDVECFAVGIGPGTFTGSRAAVAAGRALALATGRPVVPVDGFAAVAAEARRRGAVGDVAVLFDARRGDLVAQTYDSTGRATGAVAFGTPDGLAARMSRQATLVGPAAGQVRGPRAAPVLFEGAPDAHMIGACARERLRAGDRPIAGSELRPFYLRPPDAKPAAGRPLVAAH
jgi:tRNA threonylcarbamoyladenosine biosynthesis protein TsaB